MKIKVCLCEGVFDRSNPVSPRLCEGVCDRGNPGDRNGNRGLDCFAKPRKDGRGISVFARESATAANQSPFVFARESSTAAIQGSGREQGAGLLRKASQRRTGNLRLCEGVFDRGNPGVGSGTGGWIASQSLAKTDGGQRREQGTGLLRRASQRQTGYLRLCEGVCDRGKPGDKDGSGTGLLRKASQRQRREDGRGGNRIETSRNVSEVHSWF